MLTIRRLVVALLAVALSSQLGVAQLVGCDRMDMSKIGAMQSMQTTTVTLPSGNNGRSQESAGCVASVICLIGPGIPATSQVAFRVGLTSPIVAVATLSPATRALRPDFPPPRF